MQLSVSKKRAAGLLALSSAIAAADQGTKALIRSLDVGKTLLSLPPFLDIIRTENSGAAFSMLSGNSLFLLSATSLMLLILFFILLFYQDISGQARWALAALLGGGIGNWVDRVSNGVVSDYIRLLFIEFPVFNLADIFITISVVYLIALLLFGRLESTGETNGTGH